MPRSRYTSSPAGSKAPHGGAIDRAAGLGPRCRRMPRRETPMKITDITVTLFAWEDIPATQYGRHSGRFSGKSDLGLVTIKTDQGVEGHAFLGSSSRPASGGDASLIVKIVKPMLVG